MNTDLSKELNEAKHHSNVRWVVTDLTNFRDEKEVEPTNVKINVNFVEAIDDIKVETAVVKNVTTEVNVSKEATVQDGGYENNLIMAIDLDIFSAEIGNVVRREK